MKQGKRKFLDKAWYKMIMGIWNFLKKLDYNFPEWHSNPCNWHGDPTDKQCTKSAYVALEVWLSIEIIAIILYTVSSIIQE